MRHLNPTHKPTNQYDPIDGEAFTAWSWIFLGDLQTRARIENRALYLLDMSGVMSTAKDGFYRTADHRRIEVRNGEVVQIWSMESVGPNQANSIDSFQEPLVGFNATQSLFGNPTVGFHPSVSKAQASGGAPTAYGPVEEAFDNPLIARGSLRPVSDPLALRSMTR